jgi:hypothetical protein
MAGEKVDDRLLNGDNQLAYLDFQSAQVEQQIDHDLARAVVSDLAAAVDLDDRDADILQNVFRLAGLTERVNRRMFDDPQFVGRFRLAAGGKGLHRLPGRLVLNPAQAFDQQAHSATFTSGWPVKSI